MASPEAKQLLAEESVALAIDDWFLWEISRYSWIYDILDWYIYGIYMYMYMYGVYLWYSMVYLWYYGDFSGKLVGKYTSPMDCLSYTHSIPQHSFQMVMFTLYNRPMDP